jgi:hypothetical protein
MKTWLVEIRLKDWEPSLPNGLRVVEYEEVMSINEIAARFAGFGQFAARCGFEPKLRRRMESLGLTQHNCCAPDAVELDA